MFPYVTIRDKRRLAEALELLHSWQEFKTDLMVFLSSDQHKLPSASKVQRTILLWNKQQAGQQSQRSALGCQSIAKFPPHVVFCVEANEFRSEGTFLAGGKQDFLRLPSLPQSPDLCSTNTNSCHVDRFSHLSCGISAAAPALPSPFSSYVGIFYPKFKIWPFCWGFVT